jgi:hypothetical protein
MIMSSPEFPGHLLKKGVDDKINVRRIQRRLNGRGCGPVPTHGVFNIDTERAVKLFQARFPDVEGQPLLVDGKVGSITWAALFGEESVPGSETAPSSLLAKTLAIARLQIGVMEQPPGSNRGPEVDEYVRRVGLSPSGRFAWCAAFVYFCFDEAAAAQGQVNPVVKTAGVLDHWESAGRRGIPRSTGAMAVQDPTLVQPGHIFIIDTGAPGGGGHTGLVVAVANGKLVTIEGNTNDAGSAEGVGVFERQSRKIAHINKGFIDYSEA